MGETKKGTPKRGVSVFSYSRFIGKSMTLEDCFKDIYDMGATHFEMLTSHIEGYPNPTPEWVDKFWRLCEKYKLQPEEMGHWAETHLRRGERLSDKEMVNQLITDFKVANLLGFTKLRTKITCINSHCDPEPGWEKYIEMALPYAEKYNVKMLTEVHNPTTLRRDHIFDYIDFIKKTGTKHFGFNVDFGTFQTKAHEGTHIVGERAKMMQEFYDNPSKPEDLLAVLPYTYCCHAKFTYMNDNFVEETIPYADILKVLVDNGYNDALLSEYEGRRDLGYEYVGDQLRRQHLMMSNILGY